MSEESRATLETLFARLAESVRHGVIPRVDDEFAKAELYSLTSILRILASEMPTLADKRAAEHAQLAQLLESLGMGARGDGDDLRAQVGAAIRAGDAALARAARQFSADDSAIGFAALVSPGGAESAAQPRSTASATWRSLHAETTTLSPLLCEMVGIPADSNVDYAWNTEGFAAETVTATLHRQGAGLHRVVIRAQWPERPLSSLFLRPHDQFALLSGLRETAALRVPKVHGVLGPEHGLGTDAIVMEHVEGRIPTNWTPSGKKMMEQLRDAGALGCYLADLAALHSSPWPTYKVSAFAAHSNPASRYEAKVTVWADAYRRAVLRPDPLMEEVVQALLEHDGARDTEVLVHGDFRPGNTIYNGGHDGTALSTCVIDWSDATVGDIHEDLGVAVMWAHRDDAGLAMGVGAPEQIVEGYAALTGASVDERRLVDAELLATFRRCVGFHLLARNWIDRGGDIRMARAWLALAEDRRQLNRILGVLEKVR